jgi:hypothetical protein|tara:strand:+ start:458 stop:1030 length:573 start_codon:yes stop_codon:yes gene_type:complete
VAWVIIIGVLLVAIGPVLYVIPSKRDKQLAALRARARVSGLAVDISYIPNLNATGSDKVSAGGKKRDARIKCTTYTLVLPKQMQEAPGWHLARSETDNVLIAGWGRIGAVHHISISDSGYWNTVRTIVEALPGACIAVRATPYEVSWQGLERLDGQSIDQVVVEIKAGLEKIAKLHSQIDKERQLPPSRT